MVMIKHFFGQQPLFDRIIVLHPHIRQIFCVDKMTLSEKGKFCMYQRKRLAVCDDDGATYTLKFSQVLPPSLSPHVRRAVCLPIKKGPHNKVHKNVCSRWI